MTTTTQSVARRQRALTVVVWAGAATIVSVVALAVVFYFGGGRWFIVETPSMGQTAPVGTLVLDTPTQVSQLHVGDVISFHPPTMPSQVYTHRIVAISATGGITTRGDINGGPDGWTLTGSDIIGRAATIVPGVGWLVRAIPYLLIGASIVLLLTRLIRSRLRRSSWRIAGFSLTASVTAFLLKPFTGIVVLESAVSHHGATATVVSTGLMPIRVTAVGGNSVSLHDGQVGRLSIPSLAENSHYAVSSALDLSIWEWAIFVAVCAIPLLFTLIVGLPRDDEDVAADVAAEVATLRAAQFHAAQFHDGQYHDGQYHGATA